MILIKNRQRTFALDLNEIEAMVQTMLHTLGYGDFDMGILFTTNASIRKYNKDYRNQDKPTDILSFPYHTELKAGEKICVQDPDDKNMGDIIISVEYVAKKAPDWQRSLEEHLKVLLAHGIAHLLNYDHVTDEDYKIMQSIETKLLNALKTKAKREKR